MGVIARERCPSGVVGTTVHHHGDAEELQSWVLAELAWKGRPQRVKAPYAKTHEPLLDVSRVGRVTW